MLILLTGATGFIGRHVAAALRRAGHEVIEGKRRVRDPVREVDVDFTRDLDPHDWSAKLHGVDVVINAVGVLREHGEQTFDRIHTRAPQALFTACAAAGVRRVIQISALGADLGVARYFTSKHAADVHLERTPLDWTIVQPSLVYGEGGTSARLFTMLASLPVIPLPGGGAQQVQPIHIDDLANAIVRLVEEPSFIHRRVPLVGPAPLSFREMLTRLHGALRAGGRNARFVRVPNVFMQIGATLAERLPHSLLDRDTLAMLNSGNTADPSATTRLLGRTPRDVDAFITADARSSVATRAKLAWLLPLLRVSIAIVWIWTGVVSLGVYPREASYELLARTGVPTALQPMLLYGAALLDFFFGIATLALNRRRLLWLAQIALIVVYTVIITIKLPEYWLHPYGPILKNLPLIAAIWLLYELEVSGDS